MNGATQTLRPGPAPLASGIRSGSLALANSWRTGNDLMPLFPAFMEVAEGNSQWWQYAKPGQYNDPDDMALGFVFGRDAKNPSSVLGPSISYTEARLYLATWAMMKAPWMVSVDFARNCKRPTGCGSHDWPEWIVPLLSNTHLLAISQDALSAQAHRLWSNGPGGNNTNASAVFVPGGVTEVWSGPLANGCAAVMLVNKGDSLSVTMASFALVFSAAAARCSNASVFDVFGQRSLGQYTARFGMPVQPHGVELLRLTCVDRQPPNTPA